MHGGTVTVESRPGRRCHVPGHAPGEPAAAGRCEWRQRGGNFTVTRQNLNPEPAP